VGAALLGPRYPKCRLSAGRSRGYALILPPSWTPSSDLRAEHPKHLFHLRATRSGGGASAEIIVDKCKGTSLKELGKLEAVGQRFAPPSAEMTSAAQVPGAIKGSSYYQYTYSSAAGTSRLKLSVQQNRLYSLAITLPTSPSAEVETEAAAILSSFKSFPVNIFCLSASNGGTAPTPGTCY